jgi:hypothetical protein
MVLCGLPECLGCSAKVKFMPLVSRVLSLRFQDSDVTLPFGRKNFEEYLANQFPKRQPESQDLPVLSSIWLKKR